MVFGLITNDDEITYKEEVIDLAVWCQDNNFPSTFPQGRAGPHQHRRGCSGDSQELPLCPHYTHHYSREEGMTMPLSHQEAGKIWHQPSDYQNVLQLHH